MTKIILIISVFSVLASCTYSSNSGKMEYGAKIKKDKIEKIKVGDSAKQVESIIGNPSRIYKSKDGMKTYEYEYHEASRSALYFTPVVSPFYGFLTVNPFNVTGKQVHGKVKHTYLFLDFDSSDQLQNKNLISESVPARFYTNTVCGAGEYVCGNSITTTIEY